MASGEQEWAAGQINVHTSHHLGPHDAEDIQRAWIGSVMRAAFGCKMYTTYMLAGALPQGLAPKSHSGESHRTC